MLYRRNENGRYEAVTSTGKIITFENKAEMIAFMGERDAVNRLLNSKELKVVDGSAMEPCNPKYC